MKRLLILLLFCSLASGANNTNDPNIIGYFPMESADFSGATLLNRSSFSAGNWTNANGIAASSAQKMVGATSALLEGGSDAFAFGDDASDFPFQTTGTQRAGTFIFWVRPTTVNAFNYIVAKGWHTGNTAVFYLSFTATDVSCYIGTGTGSTIEGIVHADVIAADNWYGIAGTYDNASKFMRIRVRDVTAGTTVESTNTLTGPQNYETVNWSFGKRIDGQNVTGYLDDGMIANRAFTAQEIDDWFDGVYAPVGGNGGSGHEHGFSF